MKRSFDTIKLGDPMPKPCANCGLSYGYQVTDMLRVGYYYMYNGEGEEDGGSYTDSVKTTKKGTRAYCNNCGHDLKLKIDRSND